MGMAGRQGGSSLCAQLQKSLSRKECSCMNLARHAHHMKISFTHRNFLPSFLRTFSFGEQEEEETQTFHFMFNESSLVKNILDF